MNITSTFMEENLFYGHHEAHFYRSLYYSDTRAIVFMRSLNFAVDIFHRISLLSVAVDHLKWFFWEITFEIQKNIIFLFYLHSYNFRNWKIISSVVLFRVMNKLVEDSIYEENDLKSSSTINVTINGLIVLLVFTKCAQSLHVKICIVFSLF